MTPLPHGIGATLRRPGRLGEAAVDAPEPSLIRLRAIATGARP